MAPPQLHLQAADLCVVDQIDSKIEVLGIECAERDIDAVLHDHQVGVALAVQQRQSGDVGTPSSGRGGRAGNQHAGYQRDRRDGSYATGNAVAMRGGGGS